MRSNRRLRRFITVRAIQETKPGKSALGTPYHLAVITATLIHPEGFLGCWYGRGGEHLVWIQMNSPSHTACPWPYIPVALSSSDDLETEGFEMLRSLAAALLSSSIHCLFSTFLTAHCLNPSCCYMAPYTT